MPDLELERELHHPPDRVWQALVHPDELARWLGPTDLRPEVGSSFSLVLVGPPWFGQRVVGEVLEVAPGRRLVLRWRHAGQDTRVELTVTATGTGSRIRVRHAGFRGAVGALLWLLLGGWWRRRTRGLGTGPSALGWWVPAAVTLACVLVAVWGLGRSGEQAVRDAPSDVPVERADARREPPPARPGREPAIRPRPRRARQEGVVRPGTEATGSREEPVEPQEEAQPSPSDPMRLTGPSRWVNPARFDTSGAPAGELELEEPTRPDTLNPLFANNPTAHRLVDLAFDPLFAIDVDGRVISRLVARSEGWPSGNGVDLELRDVEWHDGRALRPEDVCFSVEAWTRVPGPQRAMWLDRLDGCEVVGAMVRIGVRGAWKDPRRALELVVLPEHAFQDTALDRLGRDHPFGWEPIGTGPFRGRSTRHGAVYRAADHSSRRPRLAAVRISTVVGRPEVRVAEVGQAIDGLLGVPEDAVPSGTQVLPGEVTRWTLQLRTDGVLADASIRQALLARVDASVLDGSGSVEGLPRLDPGFVVRLGVVGAPDEWSHMVRNHWQAQGLDVRAWHLGADALENQSTLEQFAREYDVGLVGHRLGTPGLASGRTSARPFAPTAESVSDGPPPEATERTLIDEERFLVVARAISAPEGTGARPYLHLDRWSR